jgi:hypothetical protein
MMRILMVLHLAFFSIGYGVFSCLWLSTSMAYRLRHGVDWPIYAAAISGLVSFATGMIIMASRKGKSECLALAASTILAFVLVLLSGAIAGPIL